MNTEIKVLILFTFLIGIAVYFGTPEYKYNSTVRFIRYDKKIWDNANAVDLTWQFGIIKNRALLWVNYENPTRQFYSSGGFHITLSFLQSHSFFGADLNNNKQCLSFYFFTEYSEG